MLNKPLHQSLIVVAAVLAAGCGKKADPEQTQAPAPAPAAPAAPQTVNIHAADYSFQAPDTIAGGWVTLRLDNAGKELHHATVLRLEQGKTFADLAKLRPTDPMPAWLVAMGGPNAAGPGGPPVEATLSLAPGSYAIVCEIPSPDHTLHVMKGMARPLTVIAPTTLTAPAQADINVKLADYGFEMSKDITAGKHTFRISTAPGQAHEFIVAKLAPGKTGKDLPRWVDNMKGPPPAMIIGGTAALSAGQEAVVTLDIPPGDYVIICFVPDAKDGKMHADHGMIKEFKVS